MTTAIKSCQMTDAECGLSEKIRDSLYSGKPKDSYLDALHDALDNALAEDSCHKMTVAQLVQAMADKCAMDATESGLLPYPN